MLSVLCDGLDKIDESKSKELSLLKSKAAATKIDFERFMNEVDVETSKIKQLEVFTCI